MQFTSPARPRRKPSLTPMIDVVFLLLVFFMLASRFGTEAMMPLPLAASGGDSYNGPPRLVDISPASVALNGRPVDDLPAALQPLMSSPTDMVILRGQEGAELQRVVSVSEELRGAGFTALVLVE
ncbi:MULTISPECIES: ExbD/TolR family protein [Sediminimonas]|uniref:ExbD/TolR family protein n=1 Tax=Sediminimonas TaxID=659427 RepID=UPI00047B45B0|nr:MULTISPECIES: biopolymer transporter ExbD [Sediminimonas]MDR9486290.1 biopolymer transporter ExbD [Sediminimonas sp.]